METFYQWEAGQMSVTKWDGFKTFVELVEKKSEVIATKEEVIRLANYWFECDFSGAVTWFG
jgi:hypothetical protein